MNRKILYFLSLSLMPFFVYGSDQINPFAKAEQVYGSTLSPKLKSEQVTTIMKSCFMRGEVETVQAIAALSFEHDRKFHPIFYHEVNLPEGPIAPQATHVTAVILNPLVTYAKLISQS